MQRAQLRNVRRLRDGTVGQEQTPTAAPQAARRGTRSAFRRRRGRRRLQGAVLRATRTSSCLATRRTTPARADRRGVAQGQCSLDRATPRLIIRLPKPPGWSPTPWSRPLLSTALKTEVESRPPVFSTSQPTSVIKPLRKRWARVRVRGLREACLNRLVRIECRQRADCAAAARCAARATVRRLRESALFAPAQLARAPSTFPRGRDGLGPQDDGRHREGQQVCEYAAR